MLHLKCKYHAALAYQQHLGTIPSLSALLSSVSLIADASTPLTAWLEAYMFLSSQGLNKFYKALDCNCLLGLLIWVMQISLRPAPPQHSKHRTLTPNTELKPSCRVHYLGITHPRYLGQRQYK